MRLWEALCHHNPIPRSGSASAGTSQAVWQGDMCDKGRSDIRPSAGDSLRDSLLPRPSAGAVAMLGREQFLGVYLSGALFSSLASYAHKMALGMGGASLGAVSERGVTSTHQSARDPATKAL